MNGEGNKATVVGTLLRDFSFSHKMPNGESFFENEIIVKRDSGVEDKIQLACSFVLIEQERKYEGAKVRVEGDIRLYKESKDENAAKYPVLFVKEMRVVPDDTPDLNDAEISGTIAGKSELKVRDDSSLIYFKMRVTKTSGAYEMIGCAAFGRNALRVSKMEYGSKVTCYGRLVGSYVKTAHGTRDAFRVNCRYVIDEREGEGHEIKEN